MYQKRNRSFKWGSIHSCRPKGPQNCHMAKFKIWKKSNIFRANIDLKGATANSIWSPYIKFGNLLYHKKAKIYGGTDTNQPTFSFWYMNYKSGPVMEYGDEFQMTFSCHFHFETFPFDKHECKMSFGDAMFGTRKVILNPATVSYHDFRAFTNYSCSLRCQV